MTVNRTKPYEAKQSQLHALTDIDPKMASHQYKMQNDHTSFWKNRQNQAKANNLTLSWTIADMANFIPESMKVP